VTLAGSRWAWTRGERGGVLPAVDCTQHEAVCALVRSLVLDGLALGVHDVADGGVALSATEMAVYGDVGFVLDALTVLDAFGETSSRAIVCVDAASVGDVIARAAGINVREIGRAGGDRLVVDGLFDIGLRDASEAWRAALPSALGQGTVQA
jgi:phosphoribosylformylglycinamidine synthase